MKPEEIEEVLADIRWQLDEIQDASMWIIHHEEIDTLKVIAAKLSALRKMLD
jgi:hypothetical protein